MFVLVITASTLKYLFKTDVEVRERFVVPVSEFGVDFSRVREHTDTQTARLAKAIKARAFTVGHNIAFGAGAYSPGTTSGRNLLAHELAHVVQQKAVSLIGRKNAAIPALATPRGQAVSVQRQ
jgi:hypothetical protein